MIRQRRTGYRRYVQAVRHMRMMNQEIRRIQNLARSMNSLCAQQKNSKSPELVQYVRKITSCQLCGRRCGVPADAALMMQLRRGGLCSRYFKSGDPVKRASAIVSAVTNYQKSSNFWLKSLKTLGEAMVGINENEIQILMMSEENR